MSIARWRLSARIVFAIYALALFTATHWPSLRIEGTGRPDIWVHFGAFSVWTGALISAGFFGPALSRRNILRCAAVATLYAAFDEATQAIPFLHRTAAFDDWLADLAGIAAAVVAALLIGVARDRNSHRSPLSSPPS